MKDLTTEAKALKIETARLAKEAKEAKALETAKAKEEAKAAKTAKEEAEKTAKLESMLAEQAKLTEEAAAKRIAKEAKEAKIAKAKEEAEAAKVIKAAAKVEALKASFDTKTANAIANAKAKEKIPETVIDSRIYFDKACKIHKGTFFVQKIVNENRVTVETENKVDFERVTGYIFKGQDKAPTFENFVGKLSLTLYDGRIVKITGSKASKEFCSLSIGKFFTSCKVNLSIEAEEITVLAPITATV